MRYIAIRPEARFNFSGALRWLLVMALGVSPVFGDEMLYQSDLAKAGADALPSEFMVLNGEFAVKEEAGVRFVELPGAPLDTYQFLFGPLEQTGINASLRAWGSKKGRLFPTFGVGLNGQSGFRVQVAPAKGAVELIKGEETVATKPFVWESDKWVLIKLEEVKTSEAEWTIRGKVWSEGTAEPAEWQLSFVDKEEPRKGRASAWGSPFSGKPIRFADLKVMRVSAPK